MTSAVEKMAYAGEVPWHGLGAAVSNKLSPEQMLKAAKIDWTVSKRNISFAGGDGLLVPIKDEYALVRDSDQKCLSLVGSTYKPIQNADAMDFFKKFVVAGKMTMETAGSLWEGRYVWGLARIGADFAMGTKGVDEVRGYLLFMSPHVHGKSAIAMLTPIRVVCWNTLTLALGSSLRGKGGQVFRMPHSQKFDDNTKERAHVALGLAVKQMEEFKEVSSLLAKKKAKPEDVETFFCEVLRFDPKKAKKDDEKKQREPNKLPKFRAALEQAPGQQLVTAKGTWWGALNAVTYVIDHETGRERSTSLRNAWLGHTATIKRHALDLAMQRVR